MIPSTYQHGPILDRNRHLPTLLSSAKPHRRSQRTPKFSGIRTRPVQLSPRGQQNLTDVLWAELEAARWREDWLANEAAWGRVGILRWVREHWVLLDGASAAFVLIQDGLMQGSAVQPPELEQRMARLERLLVGHQ
ncbi:hypothetical protein H2248_012047 [Termitomyces sp. 'cryptogamus']|nr:hypothetical protein H2248_012047 [Termitomyces sp. 'cryptogamus']